MSICATRKVLATRARGCASPNAFNFSMASCDTSCIALVVFCVSTACRAESLWSSSKAYRTACRRLRGTHVSRYLQPRVP